MEKSNNVSKLNDYQLWNRAFILLRAALFEAEEYCLEIDKKEVQRQRKLMLDALIKDGQNKYPIITGVFEYTEEDVKEAEIHGFKDI